MPPVSLYEVEASNPFLGDTGQLSQETGAVPTSPAGFSFYIGSEYDGKNDLPQQGFWRFEVDIPAGATILGVRFEAVASGIGGALGPIPMYGGFLRQQGIPVGWENPDGCGEWLLDSDVPLVDFNTIFGVLHDEDPFWGGAKGFAEQPVQTAAVSAPWSIGEGTLPGAVATVTGLIAQLQSYLGDAGNEATRGATKADSIPVMFTALRDFVGLRNQFQFLHAAGATVASRRPKLRIDWQAMPSSLSSRGLGVQTLSSRGILKSRLSSRGLLSSRISSRGKGQ